MINSLLKDSHIAQPLQHSNFSKPGRSQQNCMAKNEAREYGILSANKKQGIIANKPADINFRGLSNLKLSDEQCLKTLIAKTRKHFGANATKSKVIKIIGEASDVVLGHKPSASEDLTNYINAHKNNIDEVIAKSKEWVTKENEKKPLETKKFQNTVRENIRVATDLVHVGEKPHRFFKFGFLKSIFTGAAENPAVFNAGYAALLACIIRPSTLIALPSKKHKDDQKYAASHSIASGLIGLFASFIISNPISKAVKKLADNPSDRLGPDKTKYDYLGISEKGKLNGKTFKTASDYLNLIPDAITGVPKAIITIALLPPILKYVLGYKKSNDKKINIEQQIQDYTLINFKSTNTTQKKAFQNFTGGLK